jgi:hypothetical protein
MKDESSLLMITSGEMAGLKELFLARGLFAGYRCLLLRGNAVALRLFLVGFLLSCFR